MNRTRRDVLAAGLRWAAVASLGSWAATASAARSATIRATPIKGGLTLLDGAGANVVALAGPEGSLLVDGGLAQHSAALLSAAARATGNRRVATLVNTHWHPAQTGSNEAAGRAGAVIIAHEITARYLARPVASVDYDGLHGPLAVAGRPTQTTRRGGSLVFAGQPVVYGYLPAAHTNGDLYVFFPEADVLVTGGPVCADTWPVLDWRNGAWLGGLVRAHETLAGLVRPGTRVVPASGRLLTGEDLRRQHGLFAAFHEQMVVFQNRGMDTGDILAARPLQAHEAQFGDATAFIRGAFASLNLAYSPD